MKAVGTYLEAVVERNPTNFRIFSPDEFASNKLDSVLTKTSRDFQWDPESASCIHITTCSVLTGLCSRQQRRSRYRDAL